MAALQFDEGDGRVVVQLAAVLVVPHEIKERLCSHTHVSHDHDDVDEGDDDGDDDDDD